MAQPTSEKRNGTSGLKLTRQHVVWKTTRKGKAISQLPGATYFSIFQSKIAPAQLTTAAASKGGRWGLAGLLNQPVPSG